MSVFWLAVVILAVFLGGLFLFALMEIAKREDRTSRHIHHSIRPFDEITLTKPGD